MPRGASLWMWLGDLGVEQEMNRFNLRLLVLRRCISARIMPTVWPETQASSSREWVSKSSNFRRVRIELVGRSREASHAASDSSACGPCRSAKPESRYKRTSLRRHCPFILSGRPPFNIRPVPRILAPRARSPPPSTIYTGDSDRKACTTCSPIDSTTGHTESNAYQSPTMNVCAAPLPVPDFKY
jgi:hypothetical protein